MLFTYEFIFLSFSINGGGTRTPFHLERHAANIHLFYTLPHSKHYMLLHVVGRFDMLYNFWCAQAQHYYATMVVSQHICLSHTVGVQSRQ